MSEELRRPRTSGPARQTEGGKKPQAPAAPRAAGRAAARTAAAPSPKTLSVAVLSGKGGVGKTNVTLNLALALRESGASVLVIDGDLGLANVDVLMGFTPRATLLDVLQGRAVLSQALHEDESGVRILPAASGAGGQAQLDARSCQQLVKALRPLAERHDFVLLDLGAGLPETVRLLARAAAIQLVVTTPEPTALADAYALVKVLNRSHGLVRFHVAANNVFTEEEAGLVRRGLLAACRKFLGIAPKYLGSVAHDPALQDAVCRRTPMLRLHPSCRASEDVRALAKKIMAIRRKMAAEGTLSPCLSLRSAPGAASGAKKA